MSAVDYFLQCPPIARTLAASTFVLSISVYVGVLPYHYIIFHPPFFTRFPPYIWSLATCFMLTGPQFGVLMDTYMIYTHCAKLEKSSPKFSKPGDFMTYILFVCGVSLGLSYAITGGGVYTKALMLALMYTSSQDDRGQMATYYIVTLPAPWLPYLMLLMTWLMEGKIPAIIGLIGLIAAHMHDFMTRLWPEFGGGSNLLPTPAFIRRLWETRQGTAEHKAYGTSFAPAQRKEEEKSASGGPMPDSWKTRGKGNRLG